MTLHGMRNIFLITLALVLYISYPSAEAVDLEISGKVFERGTGKPLEGITVILLEAGEVTAFTEADGSFSLTVNAPGTYSLVGAAMGYIKSEPVSVTIEETGHREEIELYLTPVHSLMEVVVEAERYQDRTGKTVISGGELMSVAGSGGDPLRSIQALPGITTSNDASSNPAIRGTGPSDNAYYVDFLPVGYLFHMGGLISVINGDLVKDFNIYASSFGPEFANVTGGIIDVRLRNPKKDRLAGRFNISLLEADFLVEGPVTDSQSFYLGARRSYIDFLLSRTGKLDKGVRYRQFPQYYDYQGKYLWDISENHSLAFQLSGAHDSLKLTLTNESDEVKNDPILEGNYDMEISYDTQALVLRSKLSPAVHNTLGLGHLSTSLEQRTTSLGYAIVDVHDVFIRDHISVIAGESHEVLIGLDYIYSTIDLDLNTVDEIPSDFDPDTDYTSAERFTYKDILIIQSADLSVKDRWNLFGDFVFIIGGKASYEDYFDRYVLEPRLGGEYSLTEKTLLTAGWGQYHQFPAGHEVIKVIGNPDLGYIRAEHYTLGAEQDLGDGWTVKLEGYYKKLSDVVVPDETYNYLNEGSGKAYGSELLIRRNSRSTWWGWLSFDYSRTFRRNELTGEDFSYRYDQPLVINAVFTWEFAQTWTFGARWRYQSGAPYTPVIGTYQDSTGRIRPLYGALGSERLPDYHRLDLRIQKDFLFDTWKLGFFLDIINAYARSNVSGYNYKNNYTKREPVYQLPFLPSVGIHAEF